MMKISKPILTNDFLRSPVQFTSLNTIVFKNVKNVYDGNEKIVLEYEHSSKIEVSSRDWIGIFPRGWSTLQQYVTFEWVSQSLPSGNNEQNKENGDLIRRTVNFCPKYHIGSVSSISFYQFVYISKQIEVLGVSSYFRFDVPSINDTTLELECLVPVSSKLRSTSVSDMGLLLANKISSATSLDTRTLQATSIHSLQNLDSDVKNWTKAQVPMSVSDLKKPLPFPKKSTSTGDALDPYVSHSEPVFPMTFPLNKCKKCFNFKRGGEFLRSQQVLQSKVGPRSEGASEFSGQRRILGHEYLSKDKLKIVMERNKVLEERTQEMKKETERLQVESKRLKTSLYNINREKVAYEKFVKDFIKSLEKDSIVRVVNGNTEVSYQILVKKVNYVGMEEHPRDKKTSKRERELKAVIGLQEITIRNLINSLQEKAKSVQELNQTVKLAQAFSAAGDDSREYGSDAEETLDEVSTSDVTTEYEFSLSKPSPPEEVTVHNADAVLDGIRRASEMELKDIGISRSLGKISSRNSEPDLGLPSLSVHSYQNQSEGISPKKPRLFDNVEDCWPFVNKTPKVVHKKIIDTEVKLDQNDEQEEAALSQTASETNLKDDASTKSIQKEASAFGKEDTTNRETLDETEGEPLNCENYYDACEALNPQVTATEEDVPENQSETEETQQMDVSSEMNDNEKTEKNNFLMTAIIPRDLDVKSEKSDDMLKVENSEAGETKPEVAEKGKKFTCQLSIDFAAKVLHSSSENQKEINNENLEEIPNTTCNPLNVVPNNSQLQLVNNVQTQGDKPLLSFKKSNKCLEIKITQLDQKENPKRNFFEQKMVLKFEKNSVAEVDSPSKNSKFQLNFAVSNAKDSKKVPVLVGGPNEIDSKLLSNDYPEMEMSPRTVWNDATDTVEDTSMLEQPSSETPLQEPEQPTDDAGSVTAEEPEKKNVENDMNLCQDSLRYEKNLEFLQQKTDERTKDEEASKDKPSAILIQNGQTKLALIRYQ